MDQKRREVWATKDSLLFCPADKKILPKGEGPKDKFGPEERESVLWFRRVSMTHWGYQGYQAHRAFTFYLFYEILSFTKYIRSRVNPKTADIFLKVANTLIRRTQPIKLQRIAT